MAIFNSSIHVTPKKADTSAKPNNPKKKLVVITKRKLERAKADIGSTSWDALSEDFKEEAIPVTGSMYE